jgi:hypothetical protein
MHMFKLLHTRATQRKQKEVTCAVQDSAMTLLHRRLPEDLGDKSGAAKPHVTLAVHTTTAPSMPSTAHLTRLSYDVTRQA